MSDNLIKKEAVVENEQDILSRAVIPFMIWDQSIPCLENEMPPIGKCGTCFFCSR